VTYEESVKLLEEVIEPACESVGLDPVRADGLTRAGEITDQVFRRLRNDDVVIADVTAANPNVMYELGLRHTLDKLTVQLGEYGRLPFDINVIRTIVFSRSVSGLIDARDQLIAVLEAGLAGEYDPVSATRVWAADVAQQPVPETEALEESVASLDEAGFLDLVAEAEAELEKLPPLIKAVGECIVEMGSLAQETADANTHSDTGGAGMRGRLANAIRYASSLEPLVPRLELAVAEYAATLEVVSAGTLALIDKAAEQPDEFEKGRDLWLNIRRTAASTREGTAAQSGLVASVESSADMSRVLREPSRRIAAALNRFIQASAMIDEWDRRLSGLGIPIPPDDWQPGDDESPTDEPEFRPDAQGPLVE
jgi:hypothetical protein